VVREGVDLVGRELLSMLREWVDWVGLMSGRESVRRLSGTGGRESESGGRESTFIWKPSFQMKDGKTGTLRLVVGDRTETVVRAAVRTNEMAKLMGTDNRKLEGTVQDSEMEKMTSEKNGVSVEGELVFSRAVGEFLKEEVRAGSFKGNYMLNLKEQMKARCKRENGGDRRMRILLVGASQIGRIGAELVRSHGEKVRVTGRVRMGTEHTELEHGKIVEEVRNMKDKMDVVVIGGPGSSLVRHGRAGERGFDGERQVRVVKNKDGEEELQVTYHMTDPVKITMTEKVELVDGMVDLMTMVKRTVGDKVTVVHVTMFPRFVEQCCRDHMTDEDVWLLDGIRRDVNREIRDTVCDRDSGVEVVDWWQLVNARNEMTLGELRRSGVVDGDNVHLTARSNRIAAASLLHRLLEKGAGESCKRRRME
jgi:nucleotide-binding universal stress UspA family protein